LDELNVRVGKFLRSYGLNDPNHNLFVRRDLGFGFDTETYNAEMSYLGETISAQATYIAGANGDRTTYFTEKGTTLNASYFFWEGQKVGGSFFYGQNESRKRSVFGPWLILNWKKDLILLSEFDFQQLQSRTQATKQKGYVTSHQLKYEVFKGILPFVSFDRKRLNLNDPTSRQYAYGTGLQMFPRPHLELTAAWQKQLDQTTKAKTDAYWLMVFFYL
jgi:hypothetical protein